MEYFIKGVSFCSIIVYASERYPSPPSYPVKGCTFDVSPAIFMLLVMRFYLNNVEQIIYVIIGVPSLIDSFDLLC